MRIIDSILRELQSVGILKDKTIYAQCCGQNLSEWFVVNEKDSFLLPTKDYKMYCYHCGKVSLWGSHQEYRDWLTRKKDIVFIQPPKTLEEKYNELVEACQPIIEAANLLDADKGQHDSKALCFFPGLRMITAGCLRRVRNSIKD